MYENENNIEKNYNNMGDSILDEHADLINITSRLNIVLFFYTKQSGIFRPTPKSYLETPDRTRVK